MNKNWRRFALVALCLTLGFASRARSQLVETGRADPAGRERSHRRHRRRLRARVRRPGSGEQADGIFWKFDPAANQWTQLPSNRFPCTTARGLRSPQFTCSAAFRSRHRQGRLVSESKAWVFDMDKGEWSALPPMPRRAGRSPRSRSARKSTSPAARKFRGHEPADGLSGGGPWSCSARSRCSTPRPARGSR